MAAIGATYLVYEKVLLQKSGSPGDSIDRGDEMLSRALIGAQVRNQFDLK